MLVNGSSRIGVLSHTRLLVAAAGCLMLSALVSSPAQALEAKDLISYAVEVGPQHEDVDRAIRKFESQDFKGAQALLEQARRRDPKLPPVDILMAKLYYLSRQSAVGRATLEKVALQIPSDPEPYYIFAERAVQSGRISDAKLLYQKAAMLTQSYSENAKRRDNFETRTHVGLATVAERQDDWVTAVQHLQQWIGKQPDSVIAHKRLGRAQFMAGEYRAAYSALLKADELDPTLPNADVTIGQWYEQQPDRESATRFMERALKDTSANLKTRLAVARWLMETDQYSKAKPLMLSIVADNPKSVEAHLFMGVVARIMNDDDLALKHFEQAYLLAPQNFDAANQLALFLITQKDQAKRERALTFAETNARLHSNNSEAAIALGWIYYKSGRTRDAERVLNAALKVGRLTADSSYFVAQIFYDRGMTSQAKNLLDSALKTNRVFVHRNQAKDLLAKIDKNPTPPATSGE